MSCNGLAVYLPNSSTDELYIETVSFMSVIGLSERASDSVIKPSSDALLSIESDAVRDAGCSYQRVGASNGVGNLFHKSLEYILCTISLAMSYVFHFLCSSLCNVEQFQMQ